MQIDRLRSDVPGREIRAQKVGDLVAVQLRRRIAQSQLREGALLPPEAVLMSELRVSRPALREALRILEAESLIRIRRGNKGGAEICAPRVDVLARHFSLFLLLKGATHGDVVRGWAALAPFAAGLFVASATKSDIRALENLLEEEKKHLENLELFASTMTRFYEEILLRCGSPILALYGVLLTKLMEGTARFVVRELRDQARRYVEPVYREHSRFVKLAKAKKVSEAEAYWRRHVRNLRQTLPMNLGTTPIDIFE